MKRSGLLVLLCIFLLMTIGVGLFYATRRTNQPERSGSGSREAAQAASYVGANECKGCHAQEYDAWTGSDHEQAMKEATAKTVLGNFQEATFRYYRVISKFYTREGKFYVNTDGPDGKLHDYEIKYTFGVHPLQQYLIAFADGRMQALSIAWDTRPKELGGQRWFHMYPKEDIRAGDELHWTGLSQNWNFECAECHSTDLKKNYEPASNTFKTTWSEINVSCEACHGAGSAHVKWAKNQTSSGTTAPGTDNGLQVHFTDRKDVYWKMDYIAGNSKRSRPRENTDELEMCGRCHARRSEISEEYVPGKPLLNTHRVTLLENHMYTADGQMQDEVYNYGSFLQSKMFHEGVTCSDCHEPHSLKLRKEKEQVCGVCHDLPKYSATAHHHHKVGTREASCITCHMAIRTYMGVDQRHDHSFRIPRPDESAKYGTPNTCTDCHKDKTAAWAAKATDGWYGPAHRGFQEYTGMLSAARREEATAGSALVKLAKDDKAPDIARATALQELQPYLDVDSYGAARGGLQSSDALIRLAAVELIGAADAATRWRMLSTLLSDPVRSIRITAAEELVDAIPPNLAPGEKEAFDKALAENIAVQNLNADRPESHLNLGNLYARQGQTVKAEEEYKKAIQLWPGFIPAYVNLADLSRAMNHEDQSESWLLEAQKKAPTNASVVHSLGLLRARQHKTAESLALLERAMKLAPENARYAYVYGVGLYSAGQKAEGLAVLGKANEKFPGNREILLGLASLSADAGDLAAAKHYAEIFEDIAPADPRGATLLQQLQQGRPQN
jgi:tetratricopeptide (TPR) repeat protein